jgi:putative transposase
MSDSILLSEAQMRRIEPYFPLSHGIPRVNDRRIIKKGMFPDVSGGPKVV